MRPPDIMSLVFLMVTPVTIKYSWPKKIYLKWPLDVQDLSAEYKADLVNLLKEYVDCFAWEYHEMSGLSRDLVEHRLPIKAGFRPYKQSIRHFNPIIYDRIKTEINRSLDAGFIRSCRYADWISNIVPVEKNGFGEN